MKENTNVVADDVTEEKEVQNNQPYTEEPVIQKKKSKAWIGIVIAVAMLSVVGVILAFAVRGSSENKLREQLELAERYLEELDYEQAIAAYEEAIEIDPRCEDAYLGLADVYVAMGDYEAALEVLEEGIEELEDAGMDAEDLEERLEVIWEQMMQGENAVGELTEEPTEDSMEDSVGSCWVAVEACAVDGVYHHAYYGYELTPESEAFLNDLIADAQSENYETVTLALDRNTILAEVEAIQGAQSNAGPLYILYDGFKIMIDSYYEALHISLIPIADGIGYAFYYTDSCYGWLRSECVNGMFDGNFSATSVYVGNHRTEITDGTVTNGLLNGTFWVNEIYESGNVFSYQISYVNGLVEILDSHVDENGMTVYMIGSDENGMPTYGTSGPEVTDSVLAVENTYSNIWCSGGYENEMGIVRYPY